MLQLVLQKLQMSEDSNEQQLHLGEAEHPANRVLDIAEAPLHEGQPDEQSNSSSSSVVRRKFGKGQRTNNEVWGEEEERLLFSYQEALGNSWSLIARKLNRTDNAAKNHFYSTFRKSVRHINKFIKRYCRRFQLKSITNRNLLTILAACEEASNPEVIDPALAARCQGIKKLMLRHSKELADFDKDQLIDLISQFIDVTREVKRQKNRYAQTIINKISQKSHKPQSEPELKKPLAKEPEPAQPFLLLSQMPQFSQLQAPTQEFRQPIFIQASCEPAIYTVPTYQPQPIYYMFTTAPVPGLSFISRGPSTST